MNFDQSEISSAVAACMFSLTFLFGSQVHPLKRLIRDRRTIVSFGAGISTAYLFIRMIPEIAEAQETVGTAGLQGTGFQNLAYVVAMIGFLVIYGLDHFLDLTRKTGKGKALHAAPGEGAEDDTRAFGMIFYVFLLTYVLMEDSNVTPSETIPYAIAISFHFLAVDHSLAHSMGSRYTNFGRFALAGAALLGWGAGLLLDLSDLTIALLLAFISGGVIMNSVVMELPTERDGRLFPFVLGSLLFGTALMTV